MEGFKKIRTAAKAQITRVEHWFRHNYELQISNFEIQYQIDTLQKNIDKYNLSQDEIEHLKNLDATLTDNENRLEYEQHFIKLYSELNSMLQISQANTVTQPIIEVSQSPNIKLPVVNIHSFSGNLQEYKSFIDLFTALITKNSKLSESEKLYYLRSYLTGEALQIVNKLPVTNDNFEIALELLDKRFNNKKQIVNSHIHQLFNVPSIDKCNQVNLRRFINNSKSVLDSISNLNLSHEELSEALLLHVLENKIDFNTKQAFEQSVDKHSLTHVSQFLEFIEDKCIAFENTASLDFSKPRTNLNVNFNSNVATKQNNQFQKSFLQTNTFHRSLATVKTCFYCQKDNHNIFKCHDFSILAPRDRYNFIRDKNRCVNCLSDRHTIKDCISSHVCQDCQQKHHTLLHFKQKFTPQYPQTSHSRPYNQNQPSTFQNTNNYNPQENITRSTARNTSRLSQNGSHQNMPTTSLSALTSNKSFVLLATAQAYVTPKNENPLLVKILLDNGSQTSFITQSLADRLNYKTYDNNLQISGILNDCSEVHKSINVNISPKNNPSKYFKLSCSIVNSITQKLPQVSIDISRLKIPHYYLKNLADETFNKPSEIDILIGADMYYNFLKGGFKTLARGMPSLINTHLGWLLSGTVPRYCLNESQSDHTKIHSFFFNK